MTSRIASTESADADGSLGSLRSIDTVVLDQLLALRDDERRIADFRGRAEAMKASVDRAAWERVVNDYQARLAALAARAEPLKQRGRTEYTKLRLVMDRIAADRTAAQSTKAELELRHAVGELTDADLAEQLRAPVGILDRCAADSTAIDALRARFLSAFETEADLDQPAPPSDATNLVSPDEISAAAAMVAKTTKLPKSGDAPPARRAPVSAQLQESDDRTALMPSAVLFVSAGDPRPVEYRLAAVNYLGRSNDNQLQLFSPGVSRRHAVITATKAGFTIKDLASQNGVFVNAVRITEQALRDGDQIAIGDATLTYRIPWPAGGPTDPKAGGRE